MLNRDYTSGIQNAIRNSLSLDFTPTPNKFEQLPEVVSKGLENWDNAMRKKAYVDALQTGDQEKIDKALASYDADAYQNVLKDREKRQQELDDIAAQRDFQREMMDAQLKNSFALENMRHNNAMGLAQFKAGLNGGQGGLSPEQIEAQSRQQAQDAINQLAGVAERNNIGVFTDWRRKHGLTGKETEQEYGQISSAIAGLAPRAISKLKAAGVSGINSLPEFMTYIGLPQNPTSEQIRGALPMMAQIAGVENPLTNKTPKQMENPIPQQQPSLANFSLAPQNDDPLGLR